MRNRWLFSRVSVVLSLAAGCAEPCLDDGLSQDGKSCPGADAGGSTDAPEPTTTTAPPPEETSEPPGCTNGIQDGDETDVDCGGSCGNTCGGGQGCGSNDDCASSQCTTDGTCVDPSCSDGMLDNGETDIDCGGPVCPPCDDGETCNGDPDCQSGTCDAGTCASCRDGMTNGDETDVDCGGPTCPACDDGEDCVEDGDCTSQQCDVGGTNTCLEPSCDDGVVNGSETDVDCGGPCGPTCDPGEDCLVGEDCVYHGCDPSRLVCNDALTVNAEPVCSDHMGAPVPLTAAATGGSGTYAYAWTPDDGSLSAPDQAMTNADPPSGFGTYVVTVDDGFATAFDDVLVVSENAFDLQNDCTVYTGDFSMSSGPAAPVYDMGGTRECESTGNNDFAMHLCEGVSLHDVRLQGTLSVADNHGDGDVVGLVWGAQANTSFYSLTWKAEAQSIFTCDIPSGITVKRIEAPMFSDIGGRDLFCPEDTPESTVLLDPSATTTEPWIEGESYLVTIDFAPTGSTVTVERVSDGAMLASFVVADTTFTAGYFGSLTFSQHDACTGPLLASCL